jgi:prolyl oligopeptidase
MNGQARRPKHEMNSRIFTFLFLVALFCGCVHPSSKVMTFVPSYPVTVKTNQVDDYHGTLVSDPYRWLEDDNSDATKEWVKTENQLTFSYLETIPERASIKKRLTELWNYEKFGVPTKEGGRYFFTHNSGLQNQSPLYVTTALDAEPALLLDPNTFSTNGTVSLAGYSVSDDGNLLAYGIARAGSDWEEWRVRDVRTSKDLPDEIRWVKFSGASWTKDGKGFFYSRYDEPEKADMLKSVNYFQKLYYHQLGTAQSADRLVYQRTDHKEWGFSGNVTDDGHYLIITVWEGSAPRNRVYYQDLQKPGAEVVELLNDFDAEYAFIDNIGTTFCFRTDLNSPRGRVIAIDIAQPSRSNWHEIIPESADRLESASLVNDQFIATYLHDAHSAVKIFSRQGALVRDLNLPDICSVGGFGGKRKETETFYSFTSFTTPTTIYRLDLATRESKIFRRPNIVFNPADYEIKQVFYHSKDGTRVPMFIIAKKGLKLDGKNPTCLYGYGGFDISNPPFFSPSVLLWMEMGGVYAVANLRGGGEYGKEWHEAGMKSKKQNVFDDFIAAAEWLVANHYTHRAKLAIAGGSNGGLLVGACLTQRPELFGAALPAVGVMDMLRFNKFTIGWAWATEYGSSDDPEQFKTLYAYSPLHNIKPGTKYPSTLITTGDHDDRVVPAHSFKFAATLQAAQAGGKPVLIRVETSAGHGGGKPTDKIIDESADKWAFLVRELVMKPKPIVQTGKMVDTPK